MNRTFVYMQNYKNLFTNPIWAFIIKDQAFAVFRRFSGENYSLGFSFQISSKDFIN
ncbi:hypothetical protein [Pedobacter punctiformis]|uniref:Uncharacterized protein n=1 Tax=Pedobacter punctiformis TaxID=3004097 RepID=A0ABT4L9A6_9SPHI|nr:hypothetical protein [Pedobacter sp. HCMS5-2]MCZ4244509.1 hypothetical protein [Pedobacter sp. HCMS5-2]